MQDRRDFIKGIWAGVLGIAIAPRLAFGQADPWTTEYRRILARIKAPTFKKRDFSILKYGAKAGGEVDNRDAINKAIGAAGKAGEIRDLWIRRSIVDRRLRNVPLRRDQPLLLGMRQHQGHVDVLLKPAVHLLI